MQDGCKVYINSYMSPNGSSLMVTGTIFNNRLLEVGLTQNHEIMALRTLTTIFFNSILSYVRGPYELKFIKKAFGRGHGDI